MHRAARLPASATVRRAAAQAALLAAVALLPRAAATQSAPVPGRAGDAADSTHDTAVLAARTLPRGTVLGPDDIRSGSPDPTAWPIGWVTRRVIRAGETLRPPAIGRPPLVRTGSAVSAVGGTGQVRIVRSAIAVGSGARGDTILVRVPRQAAIPAVVVDSSTVHILPPPSR
jgi:flagella basal body P-ring formation protein FlgA